MENIVRHAITLLIVLVCLKPFAQEVVIDVDVVLKKVSSTESKDGSLEIKNITGGKPPYEIHWFGPQTKNLESSKIENLGKGNYVLLVFDKDKNKVKLNFTIDCCR